ncbi:RNA-binding protein 41-like [Saccoglossus kowalevskii]|uniref:RNA-binding protein 41-like n=1 Tax=Saccoglossus kowalevskii TaxID=10224 RepID=A0ABM0M627_SACKO|nr:PREDICTED: RNA-binding protein 41-like [Saccoglossus kowalevskii]
MEQSTSYRNTGIPCGDSRKYRSRGVTRTSEDPYTPYDDQALDSAPSDSVVTATDRQLKRLLDKQMDTNVSIEGQLAQKKQFTESLTFKPFIERAAGQLSLDEFAKLQEEEDELEELRQCGLSEEEIHLYLHHEGKHFTGMPTKKRKSSMDPLAYKNKVKEIKRRIELRKTVLSAKQPETFLHVKSMSRHEMEIERSLYHGTDKAESLNHLIAREIPRGLEEDPINNLDCIAQELFGKIKKVNEHKTKSSQIPHAECTLAIAGPAIKEDKAAICGCTSLPVVSSSQYGSQEAIPSGVNDGDLLLTSAVDSMTAKVEHMINNKPVKIKGDIESIPEDQIVKNRLSCEVLRGLPRFKDYEPGSPNKVLYVKNLASGVTESDLVALFIRFQNTERSPVLFRLLTGRMKGQAFITFDCVESAVKALQLINGYLLKGKPIVIQYGKKQ